MEYGFTTAVGLLGVGKPDDDKARLIFVVAGVPTSLNPMNAFFQGLSDVASNRPYHIRGTRCMKCGFLELYANDGIDT
jgi:hypothetical protein